VEQAVLKLPAIVLWQGVVKMEDWVFMTGSPFQTIWNMVVTLACGCFFTLSVCLLSVEFLLRYCQKGWTKSDGGWLAASAKRFGRAHNQAVQPETNMQIHSTISLEVSNLTPKLAWICTSLKARPRSMTLSVPPLATNAGFGGRKITE